MKTIKELRKPFDFNPKELCSRLNYIAKENIDWDVFLPTKGCNLQRDLVWTIQQKQELIWSVIYDRHIPHCAIINGIDPNDDTKEIYYIIDGKQRLSTLIYFYNNKFPIIIDDNLIYFKNLPHDYQLEIAHHNIRYYVVYEEHDKPITDEQKIMWFKFINFAGTPQDKEHFKKLSF
jgi:uncharacterized protein with ParB-like and HNH nuclease domain